MNYNYFKIKKKFFNNSKLIKLNFEKNHHTQRIHTEPKHKRIRNMHIHKKDNQHIQHKTITQHKVYWDLLLPSFNFSFCRSSLKKIKRARAKRRLGPEPPTSPSKVSSFVQLRQCDSIFPNSFHLLQTWELVNRSHYRLRNSCN